MKKRLAEFIQANEMMRYQPGNVDCSIVMASWAIWNGHPDPAAHLRGQYDSEDGYRKLIENAGSLLNLVESCAVRINLEPLLQPQCGAVGVIGSRKNIHRQFGAIFDGTCWKVRTRENFCTMIAAPLAIWFVPCLKQ